VTATSLADLDAARAAFVDAVRRHEPATIAGLYSARARVVAPGADVLRGRADVAAFWGAGMETGVTDVELVPEDVELLPSTALEVGRYVLRVEPEPGAEVVDRGRYLLIYRLDDGRWVRAAEMFAPDEPAPTRRRKQ
jgi:ketosteroid isomerase-like protein